MKKPKLGTVSSRTKGISLTELRTTQMAIEELTRRVDKLQQDYYFTNQRLAQKVDKPAGKVTDEN